MEVANLIKGILMPYLSKIRTVSALVLAFASLSAMAMAQERSAGGPVDTQMTWSALTTLVNAANAKSDAVNSRVDQVVVCARKGKVYAPAPQVGADAQGCLSATVDFTAINTAITNLTNNLTATTSVLNSVIACNNKGMTYAPAATGRDAANCVSISSGFDDATWHDMRASRLVGKVYRNTRGKAIQVAIVTGYGRSLPDVSPNGTTWLRVGTGGSNESVQSYTIVPKNWYYRLNNAAGTSDGAYGSVGYYDWMELY